MWISLVLWHLTLGQLLKGQQTTKASGNRETEGITQCQLCCKLYIGQAARPSFPLGQKVDLVMHSHKYSIKKDLGAFRIRFLMRGVPKACTGLPGLGQSSCVMSPIAKNGYFSHGLLAEVVNYRLLSLELLPSVEQVIPNILHSSIIYCTSSTI